MKKDTITNVAEVLALRKEGFEVVQLNHSQYRVNGQIDFYPPNKRYHVLWSEKRGTYTSARQAMKELAGR